MPVTAKPKTKTPPARAYKDYMMHFDPGDYKKIRKFAFDREMSIAAVIRTALQEYFERERAKKAKTGEAVPTQ